MAVVGSTVYLHSTNTESSYSQVEEEKNQQHRCLGSTSQQDLQLLAQLLQEYLRAEIPSGEFFLVRCAFKKKQTMVLIEHPSGVRVDTKAIFTVLEEALESELNLSQQYLELFIRVVGAKLPYAKCSLKLEMKEPATLSQKNSGEDNEEPIPSSFSTAALSFPLIAPSSSESIEDPEPTLRDTSENEVEVEILTSPPSSKTKLHRKITLICGILGIVGIFGTAGYLFSSPCVVSKCSQIDTAEMLTQKSPLLVRGAASDSDLVVRHKKLNLAINSLKKIPRISPHHNKANELIINLSQKSEQIEQVLQAFQTGRQATQASRGTISNLSELQNRQQLWRDAIAPLETISLKSELYNVVRPKLTVYRQNLKAVNELLFSEQRWLKKIKDASSVAKVASARQTQASSLKDLQKAQSTWQIVVNALKPIPKTSVAYFQAQQKLAKYQPKLVVARQRTNQELAAAKSYEQILSATNQAERYERSNQLELAVMQWKEALNTAQNIASNTSYSQKAQSLVEPLSSALTQAQRRLKIYNEQDKTRNDLERTCSGEVIVCEYTFNNKQIVVRVTREYEQALEQRLIDASLQGDSEPIASVNNHLQTLQQALEAISINAKSSLIVYDAQGNVIQESKIH